MKTSRDDIVDKAFPVFLKKGADGASMADLVQASGLSKGAFYYYFPDKASLFDACVDRFFDAYLPAPSGIVAGEGQGALAYIEALWRGYAAALAKAREACGDASAYLRFLLSVLPLRRQAMKDALRESVTTLTGLLLADGLFENHAAAAAEAEGLAALIEGAGVLAAVADEPELEGPFRRLLGPRLERLRKPKAGA